MTDVEKNRILDVQIPCQKRKEMCPVKIEGLEVRRRVSNIVIAVSVRTQFALLLLRVALHTPDSI